VVSVIQGIQNLVRLTRVSGSSTPGQPQYATITPEAHSDYLRARTELLTLYRDIERLAELTNINTRFKLDLPDAVSASPLGLDMTHTATFLDSSDEINAWPRSFSPFGPAWNNGSDALLTIGGQYDGTDGTGALSFEVRNGGTHGTDNLQIRVESPGGGPPRNIGINKNDPIDQQYSLQNGLFFTLGAGSLIDPDTTSIQLFENVGAVVDPDQPLGGVRNQDPNFEFSMPDIVDGSFDLNGQNISVSTSDTLNDVIQRINNSSAGVTAVFDSLSERIELLQDTLGSSPTIDFQNDTSNLLQAAKLDSANVVAGIDPETVQALDAVGAFAGVTSGDIVINGQQIAVDTTNDSLSTVLDKINNSSAGVMATFDPASQQVTIEANESSSVLDIDSNGTGFFAALNIQEGRVDPEAVSRGISRRRSYEIADAAAAVFERLNRLFQDSTFVGRGSNASLFRIPLEAAVRAAFGGASSGDILGIQLDDSSGARARGDYTGIDRSEFTSNLQRRGNLVRDFLAGEDEQGGLVQGLLAASQSALQSVNRSLGLSGTFVDTYA